MASDRTPPEDANPFGYWFDWNQEPPTEPPPEPPSGEPLLTETDTRNLDHFFEAVTANQYNSITFGEGLNFSDAWNWRDLPPQLMGTATSFGPQAGDPLASSPAPSMLSDAASFPGMPPGSHMMGPPPPPPPPPPVASSSSPHVSPYFPQHRPQQSQSQQPPQSSHPHSNDVLNAAATLLRNNPSPRGGPTGASEPGLPRQAMGPPVGHLRHQPLEDFRDDAIRASAQSPSNPGAAPDWMYSPQSRRTARDTVPTTFQWGSDSNFSTAQGYTPGAQKDTVEAMQREQLRLLDSLEVSKSANNTRPSSPVNAQGPPPPADNDTRQQAALPKAPEDTEAPPRKRRKSRISLDRSQEQGDGGEQQASPAKLGRPIKYKVGLAGEASPPAKGVSGGGKKKRGASSAAKPPRENLSEEQKRENHIKSEQKRRTLIKEGFNDISDLVPALRGGGFSKSTMLTIASEWLDELLQGNEALAKQLNDSAGS
ncbi:hypothetical protein ACRE_019530 [Hapsidospora chrysogenum ATCC 11550]|uniref:BHLH domain-containing protein n=1 Tax=Hapsidospora chrysogenum (strain ATCC 11550 / CBS 779.69 / DSM 880 / IAM 14645 / JCM 23072 / IMI 49137) TaxID=857340 RepID=A0A086TCR9_HAPC1|nr:hypothetical protein ACRE_019530 [Hapsidospora chrysogenum ATCC 11550]